MTSNAVLASAAGAAPAAAPPAGAAATATGAAADTPQLSSSFFTSSAVSITVNLLSCSTNDASSAMLSFVSSSFAAAHGLSPKADGPTIYLLLLCLLFVLPARGFSGREISPKFRNSQALA